MKKMTPDFTVWVGFDPREAAAFAVAKESIRAHTTVPVPVYGLVLDDLRARGLYTRPTEQRGGQLWDVISDAPMATQFAVSRFLVPHLAGGGWALFMDCDMLVRTNLRDLLDQADPSKAVMVVKHDHRPSETVKMDGQEQTRYARKNWSSVCLWNVDHPSNKNLTLEMVNSVPGRDLHAFCWLKDSEIGELHPKWNYLVGHTTGVRNPSIVHFTDGIPAMPGYENCEYAGEWRRAMTSWASGEMMPVKARY